MKVLLVVPTFGYVHKVAKQLSVSDFPAGFAYVAASLKEAGHEVIGLNVNNMPQYKQPFYMLANELAYALEYQRPDLIGLGGICTDYPFIRDAMAVIRSLNPKVPIVLGGGIISNDREFIFEHLKPDYGIVGEAEETVVQLASAIDNVLDRVEVGHIQNLSHWQDGKAVHNAVNHNYRDINARPFPDYEVFGGMSMVENYSLATRLLYRYSRPYPRPFAIVTARGCPYSCTFCVHRSGATYRARSIDNIVAEIKQNYEKYKFNILLILDELFVANKERMKEFCEAVLDGKERYGWDFDWMFQTHANARLDYDSLAMAKRAGCVSFSYGLESASETVLKSMNKKSHVPDIIEAIRLAQEVGIGFSGNLIFGDPAETEDTIHDSLDFWYKYGQDTHIFLGNLTPYPGNALFDHCVSKGLIKDKAQFYETIEQKMYHMCDNIPPQDWLHWVNFFAMAENNWFAAPDTKAVSIEVEEDYTDPVTKLRGKIHRIKTICPHCGEPSLYREFINSAQGSARFLGTGCQHCNKRVRVNLRGVPVTPVKKEEREAVLCR